MAQLMTNDLSHDDIIRAIETLDTREDDRAFNFQELEIMCEDDDDFAEIFGLPDCNW